MTGNESLIQKLEAAQDNAPMRGGLTDSYDNGFHDAFAIVCKHEAEKVATDCSASLETRESAEIKQAVSVAADTLNDSALEKATHVFWANHSAEFGTRFSENINRSVAAAIEAYLSEIPNQQTVFSIIKESVFCEECQQHSNIHGIATAAEKIAALQPGEIPVDELKLVAVLQCDEFDEALKEHDLERQAGMMGRINLHRAIVKILSPYLSMPKREIVKCEHSYEWIGGKYGEWLRCAKCGHRTDKIGNSIEDGETK